MSEFLRLVPPEKAKEILFQNLPVFTPQEEIMDTRNALGRIVSRAILATEPLPAFSRSSVDGYAVRAEDTYGSSESLPAYLKMVGEVSMGAKPDRSIGPSEAVLVYTGAMLPKNASAVVMLEHVQVTSSTEIEISRPVGQGENVIFAGEDVQTGQEILPRGACIRPVDMGGLMALGILKIPVVIKPKIAIISSGDEIVTPDNNPEPGQVRDVNTYSLGALVQGKGGEPVYYGIIPDWKEALRETVRTALRGCDAVVITAGSSISTRDLTAEVIQEMGDPGVLVHGILIRPGKPTILAVSSGKPIVGLPGNPVSAYVVALSFVVPILNYLLGKRDFAVVQSFSASLSVNLPSQAGREDWVPVRIIDSPDGLLVEPVFYKSNLIFSLVRSVGLICVPSASTGLQAGDLVKVYPI